MSNSKIITGLLNTDCATITENIKLYMDTKLNEINTNMTATIQQHMTENINKFYTGFGDLDNEDAHKDILFDTVCDQTIIDAAIKSYTDTHIKNPYGGGESENTKSIIYIKKLINATNDQLQNKLRVDYLNKTIAIIKRLNEWTPKTKCFKLTQNNAGSDMSSWSSVRNIYYFNNFMISHAAINRNNNMTKIFIYTSIIHSLPYYMLFTIKNTFIDFNFHPNNTLENGGYSILETYNENPQYFMPNVRDFESHCKIEYEEIDKKQNKLDELININENKIDYYKQLESEHKNIENKQQLLKVEKEKLAMAYAKFNLMRDTFIQEKTAYDIEIKRIKQLKLKTEIQTFDIDKFLQ